MNDEQYFNETEMRDALCEVGRRVWQREYVASNDGNFSVRLSPDRILCTPTLVSKGFMSPADLPVVTPDGAQVSGKTPPTSEIKVHLTIYRNRPDVRAVVHVHPPHATAFAIARRPLPKCVLPEVEVLLGEIPIAPYATPGSQEFADVVKPFLEHHNAFLLTNHGALTVGKDPFECYYRMETLEQYCRILILAAQIGDWQQLDHENMVSLLRIREKLGYPDRRLAGGVGLCSTGIPGEQSLPADPGEAVIAEITRRVLARLSPRRR